MENKKFLIVFFLISLALFGCNSQTNKTDDETLEDKYTFRTYDSQNRLIIYFFWQESCSASNILKPILEEIENSNSNVLLFKYEINNKDNKDFFNNISNILNFNPASTPITIIGNKTWVGYNEGIKDQITNQIIECIDNDC
ncbi:MAG: hypothetical protein ACOC3X_01160 [Nanoarchaeota archaeon]